MRFNGKLMRLGILLGLFFFGLIGFQSDLTSIYGNHTRAGQITTERLMGIAREPGVWLTGGRDYQQSYHSPLSSINKSNIQRLGFAWQYDIDTTHGFEATPIVVDDVMFSSGPKGAVYSLDAKTGSLRWRFDPDIDPKVIRKVCCGMINRGVAVWQGKVFVGSLDGYLYTLDADTGAVLWKVDTITDRVWLYTSTDTGILRHHFFN